MRGRLVSIAQLMGWLAGVTAGCVALWTAGSMLPSPPFTTDPTQLGSWWRAADPAVAAMALVRLAGIAVGAYLAGTSVIGLTVRLCRLPHLIVATDRITAPSLRRLLDAVVGATLVAATATASLPAGADPSPGGPPGASAPAPAAPHHVRRLPDDPVRVGSPSPVQVRRLPDSPGTPPAPATTRPSRPRLPTNPPEPARGSAVKPPAAAAGRSSARPANPAHRSTPRTRRYKVSVPPPARRPVQSRPAGSSIGSAHTVQPGDSFWSIAEKAEARRLGRHPTDAETGHYWQTLVAANRHQVSNPDLIFPGQVVNLP